MSVTPGAAARNPSRWPLAGWSALTWTDSCLQRYTLRAEEKLQEFD